MELTENSEAISKVISPHVRMRAQPGNHYYVFVDMESPEEANRAKETLNGPGEVMACPVRISMAKGDSHKPAEREQWRAQHEPAATDIRKETTTTEKPERLPIRK